MKKMIAVVLAVLMSGVVRAADWNRYQPTEEWALPKGMATEADVRRHETARKWFLVVGGALLVGSVIANKNARGLSAKASGVPVPMTIHSEPTSGGGIRFYSTADPMALENQSRIRSKARAYRTGAAIGAVVATMCLSVAYSLRF